MSRRRVVVTGVGAVSPVGNTAQEMWQAVSNGVSGVEKVDRLLDDGVSVYIGATIKSFDPSPYLSAKDCRRFDRFIQYGIAAGIQAIEASGFAAGKVDSERVGVVVGSGIGGIESLETTCGKFAMGQKRVSPLFIPSTIINMISGNLSIRYNFRGANLAFATACTTSTHAIGMAARLIQWNELDAAVAGGAEAALVPTAVSSFAAMKALSSRNHDPTAASRPWDRERDGFVLGDGAGVIVLEEYEQAKARGAEIYAEIVGFGMSADAHHVTSPIQDGSGFCSSMQNALKDAEIAPDRVDYINAHGTSTPLGDLAETAAIKRLFGEKTRVAVSSTKSMIGHLLGAAGAVEAIVTLQAMQEGLLPPTINLQNRDENCDLDYVANEAREGKIDIAMSNSFGFGGTNGTLLFRAI